MLDTKNQKPKKIDLNGLKDLKEDLIIITIMGEDLGDITIQGQLLMVKRVRKAINNIAKNSIIHTTKKGMIDKEANNIKKGEMINAGIIEIMIEIMMKEEKVKEIGVEVVIEDK